MPKSQVARISMKYVPAIVPGEIAVPVLAATKILPAPHPRVFPVVHPEVNPWHCVKVSPPCAAASGHHKVWWRCTINHHGARVIQPSAAMITGIKSAHFHDAHN